MLVSLCYAMTSVSDIQEGIVNSYGFKEKGCPRSPLLGEETEKTVPYQTALLVVNGARITRAGPVEQSSQSVLSHLVGLHLNRMGVVVRDKATIAAHAVSCADVLIDTLFRARSR